MKAKARLLLSYIQCAILCISTLFRKLIRAQGQLMRIGTVLKGETVAAFPIIAQFSNVSACSQFSPCLVCQFL